VEEKSKASIAEEDGEGEWGPVEGERRERERTKVGPKKESQTHLCLGHIPDTSVHPTLQQMNLGQDHLIVQPLEFGEELVDEC
jgi:hypothetical protein